MITLEKVFNDYQLSRNLKPVTVRNYRDRLNSHLKDWLHMPIEEITKDMVEERHRSIQGRAIANSTMRTLRALMFYAAVKYEDRSGFPLIKINPVSRLTEVRAWHRDKRRKTVIKVTDIKPWMRAVLGLDNATIRDFLLLLMFTGMRRREALELRWTEVNLVAGEITLRDTKNGEDCTIPLCNYIWNVLALRSQGARSEFVFPGTDPNKPITAAHRSYTLVANRAGVPFCPHDLRRTFITIADELDIKNEVIKALVNHKTKDMTEGYMVRSTERLRRASNQIADAILLYAGLKRRA